MTEQENVQIAKEGYAAFARGDIASVLDLYTDARRQRFFNQPIYAFPWPGDKIPVR